MKKYKIFTFLVLIIIIGLVTIYKFMEFNDKNWILKEFQMSQEVTIEADTETIKITNSDDLDNLRNILNVKS